MIADTLLAIAHHLAVFGIFAVLVAELVLVTGDMSAATLRRVQRIDLWYGILAGAVLAIGTLRVFYGAKGAAFYAGNPLFWCKLAVFGTIGVLSVPPTLRFIRWGRQARDNANFTLPPEEIRATRRLIHLEFALFATLPVLAALMARGIGY
jgi:putative membrane protein